MDYPSYHHHRNNNNNNRYIPPPPPHLYNNTNNNFSDNHPSFNHHHNHHLIPSIHLPPPPPPLLYLPPPPPPPPPSYNPHQSHFTFLDQNQNQNQNQNPRLSNRLDNNNDYCNDYMYPPRIIDDNNSNSRIIITKDNRVVGYSSRHIREFVESSYVVRPSEEDEERIWNRHGEDNDDNPTWVMNTKKSEYMSPSNVRGREVRVREEFKQVQKESVLHRIGKPNKHRNINNNKGKGKDRDRDRDREKSSVELDVSFKSNALVAKPVVTPSSGTSGNSNSDKVQTRNRKKKRGAEFDSPLSKFSEHLSKSGSPSSSEKGKKKLRGKDSVSDGQYGSLLIAEREMGGRGHKPMSFRLKKKRKFRKVGLQLSSFQVETEDDKSVEDENVNKSESVPIHNAITFLTLEEVMSGEAPSQAMVSEKDGLEVENPDLPYVKSFGDGSTENKNLTGQNLSLINDDDLVNDLNEPAPNHENITQKISEDVKPSLGGTKISAMSGHHQIMIQNCLKDSCAGLDPANVSYRLVNGSTERQERSTTFDIFSPDPCLDDEVIIVFPENSVGHAFVDNVSRKEDECQMLEDNGSSKFREDYGSKESQNTIMVAKDNAIPNESSSDKDEIVKMVNVVSTSDEKLKHDDSEPSTDETYLLPKNDLPTFSGIILACANDTDALVTDSNDQSGEHIPNMLTSSVLSIPKNDVNICTKSVSEDDTLLNCQELFVENSGAIVETTHLDVKKKIWSTSQGSSVKTLGFSTKVQGPTLPMKKPLSVPVVPRVLAGRSSAGFTNTRVNNPNNIAKPRTWHRSASNPDSVPPPPKQIVIGQTSYIRSRSGNTLVRKAAPVTAVPSLPPASRSSVYQLNPTGPIETRNSAGSGSKLHSTYSRTGGSSAPVVRPNTPPLSGSTKLPDVPTYSRDLPSSPLEHLPASPVEENLAVQKLSEDQNGASNNSVSRKILDEGAAGKKIQYVKRKANQLVAASSSDQSAIDLDKTQASSSDGYYKRRKNQLIRTSVGDDPVNADVHKASKINIKRQSGKGISKKYKHLRFPSVWTLGSQSLGKDGASLYQMLMPYLLPWKRSQNWGNVMNISASIPNNSSSSLISRKLLLSRNRESIYTRSKHGFSLRVSKLRSVGGSSLKWLKSIERNSKRANEEATLAVAAAEKKNREQNGTASSAADLKSRNSMSRDRIYRIGLDRYKMDPSGRTLQRISDGEPSTSMQSKEATRKAYVPKRLKIGHDEYVRIGNGNQLVRNPKRRTRLFANEKIRWSLHTARSRLARKKKYCQFFTRFGKCNKDDGKCPYIHDSSKVAVCTKFLNGSCSNHNCKLTHKVIPERMQDCSYFLQGLCSYKKCPYRHVNVNSAAPICEGFLKGYCADGNECRKKHSYACPVFEATGECSEGTKCKLHHPKKRNMGLKRKQQHITEQHQKNSEGRYFGSVRVGEAMPISEKNLKDDDDDDILCQEGKFTEYISLGFSNEEGEVTSDQRMTFINSEAFDLGTVDLDELTKPIRIMN